MSKRISYEAFQKMLRDVDVPDAELAEYVIALPPDTGAFNVKIAANPDRVAMTEDEEALEGLMDTANGIARWRRSVRFHRRLKQSAFSDWPVLVTEGDSWFQFPIVLQDVIDYLEDNYLVNSLGAAGDTAENMVKGPLKKGGQEYFATLKKQARTGRLHGFAFSAAGNDVIGEDPDGGRMLARILKTSGDVGEPSSFIDEAMFEKTMDTLEGHYNTVIGNIRGDEDLKNVPIFIHGYDYCYPGGHPDDPRKRQLYAKRDQWLGAAFEEKGLRHLGRENQRKVIKYLIDRLYDMMNGLASRNENVHVVDVRNTLKNIEDWNDEIHGTSEGFKAVAMKFDNAIKSVV